jgi:hypothetical protein
MKKREQEFTEGRRKRKRSQGRKEKKKVVA